MNMKKWGLISCILVLVAAVVSACGSNSGKNADNQPSSSSASPSASTQAASTETASDPVKLTFSIWGNDSHKSMYQEMIDEYKQLKPHIDVEIMTIPAPDYAQKMSVMMATKTEPDIFWLMERAIPQFLEAGQLADLSGLKSAGDYDFSDFYPSTLELFTKDGNIHGIPFSTPPNMIYYNKSLFEAKGLKTPSELYQEGNWTYDAMLEAAGQLRDESQGIYGINFIRPNQWSTAWLESMITLVWANGADYFSSDLKSFTLDTPEGEAALKMFHDMMFESQVHPKPGDQTTFETGKIAMQHELFSYMGKAKAITDFEWDIAPMPEGIAGRGTTLGYAGYVVSEFSSHKEEAIDFLMFLSNSDHMQTTSQFFVPSRKSVLESEGFLQQGPSVESVQAAVLDQMGDARVRPAFQNFQQIDEVMRRDMDMLFARVKSIPEILEQMKQDVTPLLGP